MRVIDNKKYHLTINVIQFHFGKLDHFVHRAWKYLRSTPEVSQDQTHYILIQAEHWSQDLTD